MNFTMFICINSRAADNRFVVPYNPYLLLKLNCHINLEICSTIKCIKYLYKYVFKGPDMATIKLTTSSDQGETRQEIEYDEITQYLSARYLCPPEAMWRIYEYKMHNMSHSVNRLAVHLENHQPVYYKKEKEALNRNHTTTLTAWFDLNKNVVTAKQYLYSEIPDHYTWVVNKQQWKKRERTPKSLLNRLYFVSPKQQERFYLRLLLLNVRGAQSFEDLRTHQEITYETFKEAAIARDLVAQDDAWDKCLEEASVFKFPKQLCELFAYILVFQKPINARTLYDKYKENFIDTRIDSFDAEQQCLHTINDILATHKCTLQEFDLPSIQQPINHNTTIQADDNFNEEDMINTLNVNQRKIFDAILEAVEGSTNNKLFYIDGPGGSGKSYFHNILITIMQRKNVQVQAMAWTGIAAILLKGGQTVHSTFQLPLNLNDTTTCGLKVNSKAALAIREKKIIIWDEISMADIHAFNAIDRFLQDLCVNNELFGGKIVIVSGDFRQILPIVPRAKRAEVVKKLCEK